PGSKSPINVGARATLDVVDWNNDGRLDLVVGAYDGRVRVFLDEALAGVPDFRSELVVQDAMGDLLVPSGRSSVEVIDFDGDGRKDLVVGNTDGQLLFYANSGTDAQPAFDTAQAVLADELPIDLPGTPRSRPFLGDYDADGHADILLGAADGLVRLYRGQASQAVGQVYNNNGGTPGTPYVYSADIADIAGIIIEPVSGLVTTEAGGTASFTVVLHGRPTHDVIINLTSTLPGEGTPSPTSLTFTPDDWDEPQTVTVTGQDDGVADGGVGYSIITAPAVSDDPAYAGMNAPDVSLMNLDNDAAPTVNAVLLNNPAWSPGFAHYGGFSVPHGPDQLETLPWSSMSEIKLVFSEDVVVTQDDLVVRGARVPEYTFAGFTYDAPTHTATWTLSAPLGNDIVRIALSDVVQDVFGDALDGEWQTGSGAATSGDGNPGGEFVFWTYVAPGDINADLWADDLDNSILIANIGSTTAGPRIDLNGDGQITVQDVQVLSAHWLERLPQPGDANLDKAVNADDARVLAAHWLANDAVWTDGDFNFDHRVDDLDASIMAANWTPSMPEQSPVSPPPLTAPLVGPRLLNHTGLARPARTVLDPATIPERHATTSPPSEAASLQPTEGAAVELSQAQRFALAWSQSFADTHANRPRPSRLSPKAVDLLFGEEP
ncbi:MAG: VCBS repeat-containing protein, partial [Pirellulales bacterium]|nr:VCBS repeat-containing protein [Pirellulales bacterium]